MTDYDNSATRTLSVDAGPARAVHLVVIDGPDRGARVRVSPPVVRIGTSASAHLHLRDPTVSRIHCELHPRANGVRLVDPGSTNGTYLESVVVRDVDLTVGACVRVGSTTLEVVFGDDALHVPISTSDHYGEVIGASPEMRKVYAVLERAAPTDATVLIEGETGSGKEIVARAIHAGSQRRQSEFVPVDCGAIAANLIESELFGHVRGAFSGAVSDRRGLFEEADGGTLFLDEIGELPLAMQSKLLRALENREIRRVGANAVRKVNVRIIAATNRSLAQSVNDGTFREDLYYRLAVVELRIPPLRARRDDMARLAEHFWQRLGGPPGGLPPELMSVLLSRSWPGNVRELRNFIERSVSLRSHEQAFASAPTPPPLPDGLETVLPLDVPLKEARQIWSERFEGLYARALLKRCNGNVTHAAERAGVNRRYLQRLLARLGVRGDKDTDSGD